MPVTYSKCDAEVNELVKRTVNKHHARLKECAARITCMFAHPELNEAGEAMAPAVKVGGYPCAAKIRKTTLKERTQGLGDAEIIIDAPGWEELSEDQREALIDHELTHLEPVRDPDTNAIKTDDQSRPKFKIRLHDAQVGIFKEVIVRHGRNALDAQIAEKFMDEYGQLLMWAKDKRKVG